MNNDNSIPLPVYLVSTLVLSAVTLWLGFTIGQHTTPRQVIEVRFGLADKPAPAVHIEFAKPVPVIAVPHERGALAPENHQSPRHLFPFVERDANNPELPQLPSEVRKGPM